MNKFIHSQQSLENHTRFQTKIGKVYTCFQTKTAQNPYPVGRHILSPSIGFSQQTQRILKTLHYILGV